MHGMAEHSGSIQSIRPLRCKAIAPGAYKLFAWEDVETGAYKDPEFLKAFEALGERTTIRFQTTGDLNRNPSSWERVIFSLVMSSYVSIPGFGHAPAARRRRFLAR